MIRTNTPNGDVVLVMTEQQAKMVKLAIYRLSVISHDEAERIGENFFHLWRTAQLANFDLK